MAGVDEATVEQIVKELNWQVRRETGGLFLLFVCSKRAHVTTSLCFMLLLFVFVLTLAPTHAHVHRQLVQPHVNERRILFLSTSTDLARFVCVRNKVSACVPVRYAVVLADGALLSTGVCVCSPARCCCRAMYLVLVCRFVAFFLFFVFFVFRFVIVVEQSATRTKISYDNDVLFKLFIEKY